MHAAVHVTLAKQAAKTRLELNQMKNHLRMLEQRKNMSQGAILSSFRRADVRVDTARSACQSVSIYTKAAEECAKVSEVGMKVAMGEKMCMGKMIEERDVCRREMGELVLMQVVYGVYCMREKEFERGIEVLKDVCGELGMRTRERRKSRTKRNVAVGRAARLVEEIGKTRTQIEVLQARLDVLEESPEPEAVPTPTMDDM